MWALSHYRVKLAVGDEVASDAAPTLKSEGFSLEPEVVLERRLGRLAVRLQAGAGFTVGGALRLGKATVETAGVSGTPQTQWGGWRLGAGFGYAFGG